MVEDGALMSYSSVLLDQVRRAVQLIDKILKGAKPADIPVEQPATFEFVVNKRTAKTLGIVIPESVLLLADRVIE
jgi:putative ABC transport system substrate-binding protein